MSSSINGDNGTAYTHLDIILRQDLIDLESVRDIIKIETLIELLKTRLPCIL